jgi:type II secretory pathway component PulF
MTWLFDPSDETVDIYDHTGSLVDEGREFAGAWSDYPDVVATVVTEEVTQAIDTGNLPYALVAVADLAAENIEEGTP